MNNLKSPTAIASAIVVLAVGVLAGTLVAVVADDDEARAVVPAAVATPPATTLDVDDIHGVDDGYDVDADDHPLSASEFDRVSAAALSYAGGGTVGDIDRSDDIGEAYEVEVLTDRGELDVALDQDLKRVPNLRYDD